MREYPLPMSKRHLENVEAPDKTIDGVDDAPVVDIDIVQLNRAGTRQHGCTWHEVGNLLRLVRVADVVCAHAGVEKSADDNLVRAPRPGHRQILMQVVSAEPATAVHECIVRR